MITNTRRIARAIKRGIKETFVGEAARAKLDELAELLHDCSMTRYMDHEHEGDECALKDHELMDAVAVELEN